MSNKKNTMWILLLIAGGILMVIGSATGSAFYHYLLMLATPYIGPEFIPLVSSILTVLEYISFYGGYSVLVGAFFIIIKWIRIGKIIIMIATSFGMLGLVIYVIIWAVGIIGIPLDPPVQAVLTQIYALFTFNSGTAFTGTVLAVVGRWGVSKAKKAEKEDSKGEEKSNNSKDGSKFCPNCGASLPKKANFCNKCGKNF